MKNLNYKQHNKLDTKFDKQVNHLQSFIGMPMWNGRNPTLSDIREYDRRLIEKQSQVVKQKRKGLLSLLFTSVKAKKSHASDLISNTKRKTKSFKHEITKPINTKTECCS